ncbi:MAG: flavodoxin-dependent (E)-4-hydroxy-3-methylbut-2-enyl-diphosphate synthase, partial [Clostridia bacterium]|nr:flavodoxin-dependent (E)-4-hydroxy-3-methylbut-2-enyl-diphosphate synthase [Clostridia bacterium]
MTREVKIGSKIIGGGNAIAIQSMTNTPTADAEATLGQIRALFDSGCDIVRCAVPNEKSANALRTICLNS